MKTLLPLVLFALTLTACKKEEQMGSYEPLVGEWTLVALETEQPDGRYVWQDLEKDKQFAMTIRADGAVLDANGKSFCCRPEVYYLNGRRLPADYPQDPGIAPNCAFVLCAQNQAVCWDLDAGVLIAGKCSERGARYKYVRTKPEKA